MIKINCDIGEREADNPIDLALMERIQIANIACGGHAGNAETVAVFRSLAAKHHVGVSAHLSYPDRDNFGRVSMDMAYDELIASLDSQISLIPQADMVKFHGGLYHDSCNQPRLAKDLAVWLKQKNIETLIAPHGSEIHKASENQGIRVLCEAFVERRYQYNPDTLSIGLMDRKNSMASIHKTQEAIGQCLTIIRYGFVEAYVDNHQGGWDKRKVTMPCHTVCIHSDSPIALELAEALGKTIRNERGMHD